MSKKFFVGICCLALLATSAASAGIIDNFDGYTGVNGDAWTGTAEFGATGWGNTMRNGSSYAVPSSLDLATGYNSTQGLVADGWAGSSKALDTPQDASSTYVQTLMFNGSGTARMYLGTQADLLSPSQPYSDGWMYTTLSGTGANLELEGNIDGVAFDSGSGDGGGPAEIGDEDHNQWSELGWYQLKMEVDTNANARPTQARLYWRDIPDAGPASGAWNQITWAGEGNIALGQTGDDWKIEAAGFAVGGGQLVDNFTATPEPATMIVLALGGLVVVLRRRR